jgi:ferredoxin
MMLGPALPRQRRISDTRIDVDFDQCESNGICVGIVPDVFEFDDNEHLLVLVNDALPLRRQELLEVVGSCPRGALTLTDVNGQLEVPAGGRIKVPTPCGDS